MNVTLSDMSLVSVGFTSSSSTVPTLTNRFIVAILFFFTSVIGILGNILVIIAVILSRKLRTVTNAFVVNLAVADLLTSISIIFLALSLILSHNPPVPHWLCGVATGFLYTCLGCSLYTLASIAVNRLLLITASSATYRKCFRRNIVMAWICSIWVIVLSISVLPGFLNIGELGYDSDYHICGGVTSHPMSPIYEAILVLGLFPLPLIVITICYAWLFTFVTIHQLKMQNKTKVNKKKIPRDDKISSISNGRLDNEEPMAAAESQYAPSCHVEDSCGIEESVAKNLEGNSFSHIGGHESSESRTKAQIRSQTGVTNGNLRKTLAKRRLNHQLQITANLFLVVCAFLVALSPYFVVFLLNIKGDAVLYASSLVFINSCVNPVIYAFKHPHFKTVFRFILLGKFREIPEPADFLKSIDALSR
ncbi:5-hydroxytryptamine receptor [Holothuria leucospilota]|uniref:5-hydroxytryptamine receptor n=1 Tax=Holothuria leucospilota TaxID=206669 RepID=A0A9Q0YPM3_HOLLE|nr:5-hydroxytryptamine receptor [Holothuria leucospilota]